MGVGTSMSRPGTASLLLVLRGEEQILRLEPLPFTMGRRSTHPLVIADPHVSRDHARIVAGAEGFALEDLGSTQGTLLNGRRVQSEALVPGDRIEFPGCTGVHIIFEPQNDTASLFLTQMRALEEQGGDELQKLRLFLDFGQRLRTANALGEILTAMLDSALRLTSAERGFVFLRQPGETELRLAAGRTAGGDTLGEAVSISRSIIAEALRSSSAFVLSDAREAAGLDLGQSIAQYDLRTVVCIPLRQTQVGERPGARTGDGSEVDDAERLLGVLYLDGHAASRSLSQLSQELLHRLAAEAAQLVDNARLAEMQEAARRMEKELALAAAIQQGLMSGALPDLPHLRVRGLSLPCQQIGGDFFDVVAGDGEWSVILADVSGKGAAAALLASSLQGIAHSQLLNGAPLSVVAATVNRFFCTRSLNEKYATFVIARLRAGGEFEYINCGHVPPLVTGGGQCRRLEGANLPVGLIPGAEFESWRARLAPGQRLVLVSDGASEAIGADGAMFGDERLERLAAAGASIEDLAAAVREFRAGLPLDDDCSLVELFYKGEAAG